MKRRIAVVVLSGVLFPFAGQAAPSAVADKSGLLPAVVPAQSAHKVQVSDPVTAQQIVAKGGRLLADYGSYQLYAVESIGPELADAASVEIRDDYDRIELNAGMIITTEPAVQALRKPVGAFKGKHTHLVQFIGPVQPAWYAALEETGVRIVCYIPQNAYLIFGDADSLACVQKLAATTGFLQWENTYSAANKVHPGARLADINGKARVIGTDLFEIQLVADDEMNPETLKLIDTLKLAPIRRQSKQLGYVNIVVRVDPASLDQIAGQPDVVSIQPYFEPEKFCERQDQIVAGNLSGNSPAGPGYLAWLLSKGFTQAQFDSSNFAVDVTDSGVDNGTTSPNHFGLYFNGTRPGTSHMIYNRLEGTANSGSTIQGLDGHGNLNAHIIAGFNDLTGFPHTDAGGYRYGLGICPFVRVGSSVIFDPNYYTYPDFEDLQSRAYRDGARISNNSWGANTGGAYNSDSQRYDYLVRDAQPAGAAVTNAGNQEMVIVFAAGNAGSGVNTVGTPGTGKNLFTIAASENVHPFGGADGSGISDSGADSVNDIIYFSSRGPCDDGRIKPDIAAPGTHVSGGVAQSDTPGPSGTAIAGFTGGGVSGGPFGSLFWPTNQQFFSASSGTSHSAPGVAGGCALTRQYFINQGWNTPSPAMTKAYLMNSTRHLTGTYANDTLPSNNQGMGLMDLDFAFNGVLRILRDQLTNELFTATGQTCVFEGRVADTGKPFRITLAWTDAPGNTSGNAYNNDLNLTVNIAGNTYKGNVFSGASSVSGGTGDAKNNVESVFLPAGVSGAFTVTVTAANINSDGVPNYGTSLDQDFALVIYNARPEALTVTPAAGLNASGYQGGPFTSTNIVYTLNNTSTSNLSWTAGCASNWVTVSPAGGTLSAGQTNLVTVSINANANSLGAGTNTGLIVFSNVTSSISLVRNVQLVVRPRVLDHFTWDPVSTTQYVGQAFPVRIQALDATDSLLASFTNRVGLSGWMGSAATNVSIGSGIDTWEYPMNTWWHDSRTQVIYLTNEVGTACTINSLALNVTTVPGQVMNNWTIRMKHTSLAGYGASPVWETGWTTVVQTNEPIGTTGWRTFVFSTPFNYNGTNNLLIDFSHNNSSYTTEGYCQYTAVGQNRAVYYRTDSGSGDPLGWPTNGYNPTPYVSVNIPNLRMGISAGTVVTITPTNSGGFVGGVWTGSVTVLEEATNMCLRADDGSGHTSDSDSFSVFALAGDTDGDGIPDWWEQQYYGGATNANPNAVCSNGINTVRQAYIAGLNPNDPQSSLLISDFRSLTSGKTFGWDAVSGRVYSVYWTTNLLHGFQPLETNIPWTAGSFTDTVHGASAEGFYKIKVELAP